MELSRAGAGFVRHHEGYVGRAYKDPVGILTLGIGFTWRSDAFRSWWARNRPGQAFGPGATMTRAEAEDALITLMHEEYGAAVNRFLGKAVAQHVFDGMASVVFNCGAGTLTDRWAEAMKRGDVAAAAELLKTTRVTAKGRRLAGLVSRRLDEAELIELADYTIGRPRGTQVDPMADGMLVRGERGEAVRQLQDDLQRAGLYADGVVDGVFGPGTEAAVMEFQRSAALDDDGFAGPLTLAALARAKAPVVVSEPPARERQPSLPPVAHLQPEPAMPASIGHNGGPPIEPVPTPIEQASKAAGAAKGAAKGSAVAGALVTLVIAFGWLPPEMNTAEVGAAIGIVVTAIAATVQATIDAYRAPPNAG